MTSLVLGANDHHLGEPGSIYSIQLVNRVFKTVHEKFNDAHLLFCETLDGSIEERVKVSDRVILCGGVDIEPHLYGKTTGYAFETIHYPKSDELQLRAVLAAVQYGKPVFGICRGLQVINVALGGSLKPDLNDTNWFHRSDIVSTGYMATHNVKVSPYNKLGRALGAPVVSVQSQHHQSIDRLGAGLMNTVNAHCSELGYVIEGIEHNTYPVFGVQWHPEDFNANPEHFNRLLNLIA